MRALLALALLLASAAALVLPVHSAQALQRGALQAGSVQSVATASVSTYYVEDEDQEFYQATGVSQAYDLGYLDYWYDEITDISLSDPSVADWQRIDGTDRISIKAKRAGDVTVSFTTASSSYDWYYDEETVEYATHAFVVHAISLENKTGTITKNIAGDSYDTPRYTYKIAGLPKDADIRVISDSNKNGCALYGVGAGTVTLGVYGAGTHVIKLEAYGKTITVKAVQRILSLAPTKRTKYTNSLTTCPGEKNALKVKLTGVKKPSVTWKSTNAKVAKVSKKGVVTARKVGRCYIKGKVGGATVKLLVEVTSKKACAAVRNGFADMQKKIVYSQSKRMTKNCRDCSSFVSRCYWDGSLGRRLFAIGGESAKSWAGTAASQARWLDAHGKRVSWKACSVKKLRPGDTVYYETDYKGKDASQWRYIDHAGLYVGNGYVLNTGGYGGKGNVGLRWYYSSDSSVKFIGRPC